MEPAGGSARRGDGAARTHGDVPHVANKKQKLSAVCQPQWKETQSCVCCSGPPVSTWRGWDLEGNPHFYCYKCWAKFFENDEAARCSEVRDRLEGPGGGVAALSATLKDLDISGTGGSSSSSGGSSSPVLRRKTICTRHAATPSLWTIEERSDLDPMTVVPSDVLRNSMEGSRGGGCRSGGAVGVGN